MIDALRFVADAVRGTTPGKRERVATDGGRDIPVGPPDDHPDHQAVADHERSPRDHDPVTPQQYGEWIQGWTADGEAFAIITASDEHSPDAWVRADADAIVEVRA